MKLTSLSPTSSITLAWCLAHVGVHENKEFDQVAKATTATGTSQHLPTSLAAVKQKINAVCKASVIEPPPPHILRHLHGVHNPAHIRKALAALPQHSATAITQLRAGHSPLSYRIKAADKPNFQECHQPETMENSLMLCRKYKPQRKLLFEQLHHLHRCAQTILTNPKAFKPLADYI